MCILVLTLMALSIQYTIKIKDSSIIKFIYQSQQRNLSNLQQIENRLYDTYGRGGEPGPFCGVK